MPPQNMSHGHKGEFELKALVKQQVQGSTLISLFFLKAGHRIPCKRCCPGTRRKETLSLEIGVKAKRHLYRRC